MNMLALMAFPVKGYVATDHRGDGLLNIIVRGRLLHVGLPSVGYAIARQALDDRPAIAIN